MIGPQRRLDGAHGALAVAGGRVQVAELLQEHAKVAERHAHVDAVGAVQPLVDLDRAARVVDRFAEPALALAHPAAIDVQPSDQVLVPADAREQRLRVARPDFRDVEPQLQDAGQVDQCHHGLGADLVVTRRLGRPHCLFQHGHARGRISPFGVDEPDVQQHLGQQRGVADAARVAHQGLESFQGLRQSADLKQHARLGQRGA